MDQQLSPPETREIKYFTEMEELIIPEYGRHIQNLIRYACTIEDRDKRQRTAETIIQLMTQVCNQKHKPREIQQKLWNHLLKISGYKLDVDIPEGVVIVKSDLHSEVEPLDYPPKKMLFKHYGRLIQKLISKAKDMPEGDLRDKFLVILGAYMKLALQNWHKERYVPDETIRKDFERLSDGALRLPEEAQLDYLVNAPLRRQTKVLKSLSNNNQKTQRKRKRKRKASGSYRKYSSKDRY